MRRPDAQSREAAAAVVAPHPTALLVRVAHDAIGRFADARDRRLAMLALAWDCMRAAAARLAALLALAVLLAVLLAALRPSPSAAWKCKGRGG